MSIETEFDSYKTIGGYLNPNPVPVDTVRGSDNEPLFTSAYYMILNRNGLITPSAISQYGVLVSACVGTDEELHRAPGDSSPDEIDDHLGVLAGYAEFDLKVPFKIPFRLWRFPQLVFAWLLNRSAFFVLLAPLELITAAILATSCIGAAYTDTDSRFLNWYLWQATKRKSILCYLAGLFWYWRQKKVYGSSNPMQVCANLYFKPTAGNPYAKYWIG